MYQPDETIRLEVRVENETVWLNRQQMATLFGRDVKTIGKHVNNALHEELANVPTVANFAIVQNEGNRTVTRNVDYYSIDMIMSVGYRVKSEQGIMFRRWANQVLKDYLLKGYVVNQRITTLEHQVADLTDKVNFFVRSSLPPVELSSTTARYSMPMLRSSVSSNKPNARSFSSTTISAQTP